LTVNCNVQNSVKNFFGLLKSICSTSQYDCQKARSNKANAWGETHYECNGCGRKLPTGRIDCPFCGYASQKPTKDPNAKGCFYCLFMLPFNLAMTIITAIPTMLLLALATGNMAAVDAAINGQLPQ
jgi:hypothetical protein